MDFTKINTINGLNDTCFSSIKMLTFYIKAFSYEIAINRSRFNGSFIFFLIISLFEHKIVSLQYNQATMTKLHPTQIEN